MIRRLVADATLWREALAGLAGRDISLDWRWGEHVAACYRWTPLRILWSDGSGPLAAVQILAFPYGLKATAIASPFLTTGAIAHRPDCDLDAIRHDVGRAALALGLSRIDLRETAAPGTDHGEFTFTLPLHGLPRERLMASFNAKLRAQIKRPQKDGYSAERVDGDRLLFYGQFQRKMHEFGTPVHARTFLEGMLRRLDGLVRQFVVRDPDGAIIGGMLMLVVDGRAAIPFAVVHEAERRSAANMLLYWEALAWASETGVTEVDFGRSRRDSGTFKFKQQWGATPVPLVNRRCTAAGVQETGFGLRGGLADRFTDLWSHLPAFVADAIGPGLRGLIP